MTRRLRRGWSGCRPEGAVLSFEAKESTKRKPAARRLRGGGPPRCALFANIGVLHTLPCPALRPASRQLSTAVVPTGHALPSRPEASVCGSRTVGRPGIYWSSTRPKGRNSLTTFRGQTAPRGCPRARGVRCRIAPRRSPARLPPSPAGRFAAPKAPLGPRFFRDSSLRYSRREKVFDCPFLKDGNLQCRARIVDSYLPTIGALVLTLFPLSKRARFFPSLPIAALLPAVGAGQAQPMRIGMLRRKLGGFAASISRPFPTHSWRWAYSTGAAWDASVRLGWFRSAKTACFFPLPLALYLLNRQLGIIL